MDINEVRSNARSGKSPRIITGNKPPPGAHIDLGWKAPPKLMPKGKKFKAF